MPTLTKKIKDRLTGLGFKMHNGKKMPVDPETYVETIIRTNEGFGSGGITKAGLAPFWETKKHKKGIGAIVAYREARRHEERKLSNLERL